MIVEQQSHYGKKEQSKIRAVTDFNKVVLFGKIFDVKTHGNDFFDKIFYKHKKHQHTKDTGIGSEAVQACISC